jgi:hypothetical protein
LQPFVHRATFCWVKRRSADGDLPCGSRTNACIHSRFSTQAFALGEAGKI